MLKLSLVILMLFAQVAYAKRVVNGVGVKSDGGCYAEQDSGCGNCLLKCMNRSTIGQRNNPKASSLGQVGGQRRSTNNVKASGQ